MTREWGAGRKRKQVKFIVCRRETIDTLQRQREVGPLHRDININVTTRTKLTAILNTRSTGVKKKKKVKKTDHTVK